MTDDLRLRSPEEVFAQTIHYTVEPKQPGRPEPRVRSGAIRRWW